MQKPSLTASGRIPLQDLAALPSVLGVLPSPDGQQAAFYWDLSGRHELYALDLATGERRQLTHGEAPRSPRAGFAWSPDGRQLAFSRDTDGDERQALFLLDLEAGSLRALPHAEGSMDYAAEFHPDGRSLLVNSTRGGQLNVYRLDLAAEGEAAWTALTAFSAPTQALGWSPDGTRIAFTGNETGDFKNLDGYLMNADGSDQQRVWRVREGSQDALHAWHPDGRQLAVSSDADGHSRVGVLDLQGGALRWLTPADGVTEEFAGRFSPDGRWLSVTRSRDSSLSPLLYDLHSGEARLLQLPEGVAAGAEFVLGGSKLLLTQNTTTTRSQVLLYDLARDRAEVLLPAEYGAVDPADFTEGQYIRYPSFDGQEVPAILYVPRAAREPGARLPALVHVHGGPTAQFFRGFDAQAQLLADRGYVVLCPNIRGSTGYGVAWRDANLRDWGGGDLEDVAAGAEYLRGLPCVDGSRLGVFGTSFGGFMSYLIAVKKPELFKVSVPIVGISDLPQLYADNSRVMPQLGYYFRSLMGDPLQDAELWKDRSAVTHAAKLKASMLMLHGVNDPRCPVNQARGFRDALIAHGREQGRDFEYLEFEDEGHGAGDIAGKTRTYRLLVDFLERRL